MASTLPPQNVQHMVVSMTLEAARAYFGNLFDEDRTTYPYTGRPLPVQARVQSPHTNNNRYGGAHNSVPQTVYDTITLGRHISRFDGDEYILPRSTRVRPSLTDRQLVSMRQARRLAGLDTNDLDQELARRLLENPHAWGWVGAQMAARGWVDDMEIARRLFRIVRETYPPYLWHGSARLRAQRARARALNW